MAGRGEPGDAPGRRARPRRARPDPGEPPAPGGEERGHRRRGAEERGRLRHRVLPRTVLGLTSMILAFAVGAAFSGTVLYAYYQYHLDQTDQRVNTLLDGYKGQFRRAEGDIAAAAAAARSQVQAQLNNGDRSQTDPAAQQAIVAELARSLFFVTTQGTSGQTSVGTAFVVASTSTQSLLLASYTTVRAVTASPGPQVYVRHGNTGTSAVASLRSWDAADDLALLVLPEGRLPAVRVAPSSPAPRLGQPVFAVAGVGSAGASISAGEVSDVSARGIASTVALGPAFEGAPIVNGSGQVVAVASLTYAPLGFTSTGVWYAPFVDAACSALLRCPGGKLGAGGQPP